MTQPVKPPETPETLEGVLAEVERRGLSAYCWDGRLHHLPARLAAANADLLQKMQQLAKRATTPRSNS